MQVVSFVTQKGGSGKSTLARHVAVAAHLAGKRVVILDCDMQGSLRDWSEMRGGDDPRVVVELSPNARHIASQLDRMRADGADLVVVDTPGGLQTPTPFIAAGLSDLVLIPVQPTNDDLNALWPLLPRLQGSNYPAVAVLSRCPTASPRPRTDTESVLVEAGVEVAPVAIHDKLIVPASGVEGRTVLEIKPTTDAERRTLREFEQLYAWVVARLEGKKN